MVKFGLRFKATLENVTKVRPEGDDFRWFLKVSTGYSRRPILDLYLDLYFTHNQKAFSDINYYFAHMMNSKLTVFGGGHLSNYIAGSSYCT